MKTFFYILCCMPLLLHAQADTTYNGIKFEQELTWEQVKAKAKANNKYIFVDCYATWCGPCKMMDRDVYPNPEVGVALNDHFVSVKVQMDSTIRDDEQTKKWYPTAQKIRLDYKVGGFPTYLFFSPDGNLIRKEMGFQNVGDFISLSQRARDPKNLLYYNHYQQYKQNKKDYPLMGELAIFTGDLIGDKAVSDEMAKDYKENYLDKLEPARLYTKEHIDFICRFSSLIRIWDKFFTLCYQQPERFDSISGITGTAMAMVHQTISREEIALKVQKNGNPLSKLPDWDQIERDIAKKYSSIDARRLVLDYKIHYYRSIDKDWELWAKYKDEMIRAYPPKPPYGLSIYIDINGDGGAWHAFLHCNNRNVLLKALEWINLAIKLEGDRKSVMPAYLDTKANLLYKLGNRQEALKLEKEAVELDKEGYNVELRETYAKMQRGEPTWVIE